EDHVDSNQCISNYINLTTEPIESNIEDEVWDCYNQTDQNQIIGADLETIVDAELRKKSNISLYDECKISKSDEDKTY
ncbi:641_t:CDS:2, partial [Racocetra persica]